MKKLFKGLLVAAMALTVTACGGNEKETTDTQASSGKEVKEKGVPAIKELNSFLQEDLSWNVNNLIQTGNYQEQIIQASEMENTLLNILDI